MSWAFHIAVKVVHGYLFVFQGFRLGVLFAAVGWISVMVTLRPMSSWLQRGPPGDERSWPCAETWWDGDPLHQQSMLPYEGSHADIQVL